MSAAAKKIFAVTFSRSFRKMWLRNTTQSGVTRLKGRTMVTSPTENPVQRKPEAKKLNTPASVKKRQLLASASMVPPPGRNRLPASRTMSPTQNETLMPTNGARPCPYASLTKMGDRAYPREETRG